MWVRGVNGTNHILKLQIGDIDQIYQTTRSLRKVLIDRGIHSIIFMFI